MNQLTTMSSLRQTGRISLEDTAYLLGVSPHELSLAEKGVKEPPLSVVIGYHMLFRAPLETVQPETYANLYAQLQERSSELIAQLMVEPSRKNKLRIEALERIVNNVINDEYEYDN